MNDQILIIANSNLTFRVPNVCAKFHENRVEIATIGEVTDTQTRTLAIYNLPRLRYSNAIDKKLCSAN